MTRAPQPLCPSDTWIDRLCVYANVVAFLVVYVVLCADDELRARSIERKGRE